MEISRRMGRINRIHFIGIGGAGMGGIAEVLLERLSDLRLGCKKQCHGRATPAFRCQDFSFARTFARRTLRRRGGSSAIQPDNPELVAAQAALIPIVPRAMMLAELMRISFWYRDCWNPRQNHHHELDDFVVRQSWMRSYFCYRRKTQQRRYARTFRGRSVFDCRSR